MAGESVRVAPELSELLRLTLLFSGVTAAQIQFSRRG
jgi:hypothetical protein